MNNNNRPWQHFKHEMQEGDLNWRVMLFGAMICAIATAAAPYITLKLGMGVDLSYGGMFLAAALLGRQAGRNHRQLAIQLNLIQTMVNVATGVAFMVVILAAFFYIQNVFKRDIGFNPQWWQISIWLLVSANLGVFMGAIPRRMLLDDTTLPWPTGQAVKSVAETLTDPSASETTKHRRNMLSVSTSVTGFIVFLKESLGVIPAFAGKASVGVALSLEMASIGLGMLAPLAVGLSGLLGVWCIYTFGETVAQLVALRGTSAENWDVCRELIGKGEVTDFLTTSCGDATKYLNAPSHFKWVVQWMMWPATAMMVTASLTSVVLPLIRNAYEKHRNPQATRTEQPSLADEVIPWSWIWCGITICVIALLWLQDAWFSMPWKQVLVAVAIQPILILAGVRVLGITGQGPVSLMANATQFVFGLFWPGHIQQNLNAAHIAADPQASAEATTVSFWVARRLGGRFRTLIIAQILVLPIAAVLVPLVFNLMEKTYGIGTDPGQLSAPTGLKIASLAMVMENGAAALPRGAMIASLIAATLGVILELLLAFRKSDGSQRFGWLPIPSAFGFALILPPPLMISMAIGGVISAIWRKFSTSVTGSYQLFGAPIAAGLIAGEAIVGAILIPVLGVLLELLKPYL